MLVITKFFKVQTTSEPAEERWCVAMYGGKMGKYESLRKKRRFARLKQWPLESVDFRGDSHQRVRQSLCHVSNEVSGCYC